MKPTRILVVDDERDNCANLADILSDCGHEVTVAFDGPSALDRMREAAFDLALLDLKMPGMSGLELYREIKNLHQATVAVIVTAFATSETAAEALQAGAFEILPKPVDVTALMRTLDQVLLQPTVLVVDDDRDLCQNLADLLRERNYRVALAYRADGARDHLASYAFDVVLIDLVLPAEDGQAVYQCVRAQTPEARTIMITGHRAEQASLLAELSRAGADAVCYKPFDMPQLLGMIQELCQRK